MKESISNFEFRTSGLGSYNVTYKSPITGKEWHAIIESMVIIDKTKNTLYTEIKQVDLNNLKRIIKRGNN